MKKSVYIHIDKYGHKFCYKDKKMTVLHHEDGPAIEHSNGDRFWYRNGMCHREDGPAVEHSDGCKAFYLNGHRISEAEHSERTTKAVELTLEDIAKLAGVAVSKLKIVKQKS